MEKSDKDAVRSLVLILLIFLILFVWGSYTLYIRGLTQDYLNEQNYLKRIIHHNREFVEKNIDWRLGQ